MSPFTYQTIKLSKGKHVSPREGACVMELASMLSNERFSDHPWSVCPVIGAFVRAYNDSIDDRRRQDLYAYAAKVVGSRTSAEVRRVRSERVTEWACEMLRSRRPRLLFPWATRALARAERGSTTQFGVCAVKSISSHTDETHAAVLTLIDELLRIGTGDVPALSSPSLTADSIWRVAAQDSGRVSAKA